MLLVSSKSGDIKSTYNYDPQHVQYNVYSYKNV